MSAYAWQARRGCKECRSRRRLHLAARRLGKTSFRKGRLDPHPHGAWRDPRRFLLPPEGQA